LEGALQLKSRDQVPGTWIEEEVSHKFGEDADFHYHEVDEWLEVRRGGFAFYSAEDLLGSGEPITCTVKDVLHIPQGEVHRVKITDPAGVIDL